MKQHSLLPVQHKALRAIRDCLTALLGGHIDHFDCGHMHISYNSCRNRNCPKCQALTKKRWVMARMEDLLPIPYYHVVFTLPEELNQLIFRRRGKSCVKRYKRELLSSFYEIFIREIVSDMP